MTFDDRAHPRPRLGDCVAQFAAIRFASERGGAEGERFKRLAQQIDFRRNVEKNRRGVRRLALSLRTRFFIDRVGSHTSTSHKHGWRGKKMRTLVKMIQQAS